jgi:predicted metal-binding membrane protein
MTVAMMLPGSLPLLNPYVHYARQQVVSNVFVGLIIFGFLLPWVLFGLLVYLGDSVLHRMFAPPAPLSAFSGLIAPAIMLIAGLYQFTPLKRRHFVHRRPMYFLRLKGNVEKVGGVRTLKEGLRLGVSCLRSCWALMLLIGLWLPNVLRLGDGIFPGW